MTDADPELPEYPGHTGAFGRIMRTAYEGQNTVSAMTPLAADLMKVTNEELVLLSQVRAFAKVMIWQEAIAAEIARRTVDALDRSTAALIGFKEESATASGRLLTLTRWLIAFTVVLAFLSLVLMVQALKR